MGGPRASPPRRAPHPVAHARRSGACTLDLGPCGAACVRLGYAGPRPRVVIGTLDGRVRAWEVGDAGRGPVAEGGCGSTSVR